MLGSKSILAAVDFSEHSDAAVEDAFAFALKFDAKVHLLHAFTLQDKREQVAMSEAELHDVRAVERQRLDALVAKYRSSGCLGEVIWSEGDPGSTILRSAEQHRADLIALGASGRSGLMRLALGSVAEHVVRHAPCSVWVVRRPF